MLSEYNCPVCGSDGAEMKQATYTYTHQYVDVPVKQFRMECSCGAIFATTYQRQRNDEFLRKARRSAHLQANGLYA
jgi:hypothetical protein